MHTIKSFSVLAALTLASVFYAASADAPAFEAWTWPDPSLGGLLPDLHTTANLLGIFGITANQWQRRNVLDWTQPGVGPYSPRPVAW